MRQMRSLARAGLTAAFALATLGFALARAEPVDASSLYGKVIAGYQGWFDCPNDGAGLGFGHWMTADRKPAVDFLPDVSEFGADELCDSGWRTREGKPVMLYSAQNPKSVDRHFAWMEQYGIDGVALQRFASELHDPRLKAARDKVLANVRAGAARHGRVWFLMYDLSGLKAEQFPTVVEDWKALLASGVTNDRSYQRHRGRVLLAVWGLGFAGRPMAPQDAERLITALREASASVGGVTILGGVPTWWREGKDDASADPGWREVWPKLDVISPWTVGRFADVAGADHYFERGMLPDLEETKRIGTDYMPVVFPGFSYINADQITKSGSAKNAPIIQRHCGDFYSHQITNAFNARSSAVYIAMFDELNEGTAILKIDNLASSPNTLPPFHASETDDCATKRDIYLIIPRNLTTEFHKK